MPGLRRYLNGKTTPISGQKTTMQFSMSKPDASPSSSGHKHQYTQQAALAQRMQQKCNEPAALASVAARLTD